MALTFLSSRLTTPGWGSHGSSKIFLVRFFPLGPKTSVLENREDSSAMLLALICANLSAKSIKKVSYWGASSGTQPNSKTIGIVDDRCR